MNIWHLIKDHMQVVLSANVKNLGRRGDVVSVKPGYFRNFLYPEGFAEVATPGLLKLVAERKEKMAMEKEEVLKNAKEVFEKINGLELKLMEKVNEQGHLYAAVSADEVVTAIEDLTQITLDKSWLDMSPIKEKGMHIVKVKLGNEVAEVNVVVEAL